MKSLRTVLAEKGISQNRLSQNARVPQSSISMIVNNTLYPCPAWRRRISEAVGEPEEVLFPNRHIGGESHEDENRERGS